MVDFQASSLHVAYLITALCRVWQKAHRTCTPEHSCRTKPNMLAQLGSVLGGTESTVSRKDGFMSPCPPSRASPCPRRVSWGSKKIHAQPFTCPSPRLKIQQRLKKLNVDSSISHLGKQLKELKAKGFLGSSVVKIAVANAGDTRSIPGPGRPNMPRGN